MYYLLSVAYNNIIYNNCVRHLVPATVRMRKSQSSPAATVKKAECRIQSSVRDIIVGGTATSEPMLPVTSDDEQTEAVVTYRCAQVK